MFERQIKASLYGALARGKSVLMLGPRQVGKTTLTETLKADLFINLAVTRSRHNYERDPGILIDEIKALNKKLPLVVIDEVQKAPELMDNIQYLIDKKMAQFVLTGSSARKLTNSGVLNLLPGRLVQLRMDPLNLDEAPEIKIETLLMFGSLPGVLSETDLKNRETDLATYVETYLEEEIRKEAVTKNLGAFNRFLECAAIESGRTVSFTKISQDLGPSTPTISNYYQILTDTLIAERIEPLSKSVSRKKLLKSPKFLFFDLGVRRVCAREGVQRNQEQMGPIFEQWVGLELIRHIRIHESRGRILFWSDPDGPEVDWIMEIEKKYLPIEVKYSDNIHKKDARHLEVFLEEHKSSSKTGLIVCTVERPRQISDRVTAIPWQSLHNEIRKWR